MRLPPGLRRVGVLAALLLVPGSAGAFSITASVNRTSVQIDEQIVLSVQVSGEAANLPDPQLPSMPRFNVHAAGRSQNFSFVNGKISSAIEYTYVLVPRMIGNATIPPVAIDAGGGNILRTDPIAVTVLRHDATGGAPAGAGAPGPQRAPPAGAPPPGAPPPGENSPDVFVTATIDDAHPFINQQVLLTVRFHTAVPLLGNIEWNPPATKGFLNEDLPPPPPQETVIKGRRYSVSEIQMALFPIESGPLTIGQSSIRCQVHRGMAVDPFAADFFNQFFSRGITTAEPKTLSTRRITVNARPLPEAGKPPGFAGAVGEFRLRAETDRSEAAVGDAINLTVTIEGKGNLKGLGEIALPELPQFRAYETVSSLNQSKDGTGVKGSKVYKTVLVPKVSGDIVILPIKLNFFDPKAEKYVSLQSDPIPLKIAPGQTAAAGATGYQAPAANGAILPVTEDIRHVHDAMEVPTLHRLEAALAGAGWAHLFPLLLLFAASGFASHRGRSLQDPARWRARGALAKSRKRIREGRSERDPQRATQMISEALTGYLADKFDRPASGLTLRQVLDLLKQNAPGLPAGHLEQLKRVWNELELFRFAPAGTYHADPSSLADGVGELVRALDEELRR